MAKSTSKDVMSAETLLAKRVQDMVLQGDEEEIPLLYVCRKKERDEYDDVYLAPIPVIDVNQASMDLEELERLKLALCSWGCFQAIGHGISGSLLNNVRKAGREFFLQPMEEKMKYAKEVDEFEGYGGDPPPEEGQPLDWQDRLFLDVYPQHRRKLHLWPENPSSFREVLTEYTEKLKLMTETVSKVMAKCLDLEEKCFINLFGEEAPLQARFNYYSPSRRPDLVLGLKAHADNSGYTLILQDEVQGLQILKDGKWLTVPTYPEAILVLLGDQMEILTNGTFKSPVHRVLSNAAKARTSIAVFYTPEQGKGIGPIDGLINEEMNKPRMYKHMEDYDNIHWEYYQKGLRAIHLAKIEKFYLEDEAACS